MQKNGIRAKRHKKFVVTTDSSHKLPTCKNILHRQFQTSGTNVAWVGDITFIPTREGWLYLSVFLDLYSRRVVGWSMSETMTADLIVNAYRMGLARRDCKPLLVHSDRGVQYASNLFKLVLGGTIQSMSRIGNCWDNAVAESFFSTLKQELVMRADFESRNEAQQAIFEFIEIYYNRNRIHSTLGYLTLEEFELKGKIAA